ncbi:MAG: hypothetical protein WBC44_12930 [Planctomycetaceae bacterium]
MNLAILHFHLNPGGVTRVIENHLLAIDAASTQPTRVAILHGGRTVGWSDDFRTRLLGTHVSLHAVPGLDYDDGQLLAPGTLAAAIREVLAGLNFRPDDTVLHVHNHSLGKNLSLPGAVTQLASEGWRLLLQIHDFAEDFRPANYRRLATAFRATNATTCYPQAPQIHYAALNGRDRDLLASAGVAEERLHRLPNPVPFPAVAEDRRAARRLLADKFDVGIEQRYTFYPVRGIRRKNVGEAMLLSLLDDREAVYGLALDPLNPAEKPFFDRWRRLVDELKCPLRFATSEIERGGLSFAENLAAADTAVTTSVAEGFGMAFLEPWLAELPLCGRDLPEITVDFRAAGVQLDGLYDRLAVPLDWVGTERFADAFRTAGEALLAAYNRPPQPMRTWLAVFDRKTAGGMVDFGDLDEELQEDVLRRVAKSHACRDELRSLNRHLTDVPDAATMTDNAEYIRATYSPERIGRQLIDIYRRLLNANFGAIDELDHSGLILDRLLDLGRIRLIRGVT